MNGGCLPGFATLLSEEYGHEGFLALVAKNKKALLFHKKYGFQYIGNIAVLGERMMSDTWNYMMIRDFKNKQRIIINDKSAGNACGFIVINIIKGLLTQSPSVNLGLLV